MSLGVIGVEAPNAALQVALGAVTLAAIGLAVVGWRRSWRMLLVNAGISSGFLAFFWSVTRFSDFEDQLSSTGQSILTGIAVAGIAEFANSLRIWFEGQSPDE